MHIILHIFFKGHPPQTHAQEHMPTHARAHSHAPTMQCTLICLRGSEQNEWETDMEAGSLMFPVQQPLEEKSNDQIRMMAWKKAARATRSGAACHFYRTPTLKSPVWRNWADRVDRTEPNQQPNRRSGVNRRRNMSDDAGRSHYIHN